MKNRLTWNLDCNGQSHNNKGKSKQYGKANISNKQGELSEIGGGGE